MIVSGLAIHESAHAVIAIATGGTVYCLRISAREGLANTDSPTPLGRMMTLVAGMVAQEEVSPFEIPDPVAPTPETKFIAGEARGIMTELASTIQRGERGDTVPSDTTRFLELVEDLIGQGKIKRRPHVRSRYWRRAHDRVRRMLHWSGNHRRQVRVIATALEREGALFGVKIKTILEQDPGPALKPAGRLIDKSTSLGLEAGVGGAGVGKPALPQSETQT